MKIRCARSDDITAMTSLLSELFAIEDDFTVDTEKQSRGFKLLLQNSHSIVLVAEILNDVVGMMTLQRVISTAMGGYVCTIEDVIVSQPYRGMGIGSKLLASAIDEANQRKWERLALGVDLRNTEAMEFYTKFGFTKSNMRLMYRVV
ncbi:MAG: GNAT family N-acetyltransferase [Sulfuricurvum sp.]|nr:GNAT family N-acetyltransferase [Sulfuricurvum sp.]